MFEEQARQQIELLVRRSVDVAAALGVELTTVSKILFGHAYRIDQLSKGDSFVRPPILARAFGRLAHLEAKAKAKAKQHAKGAKHGSERTQEEARRKGGRSRR